MTTDFRLVALNKHLKSPETFGPQRIISTLLQTISQMCEHVAPREGEMWEYVTEMVKNVKPNAFSGGTFQLISNSAPLHAPFSKRFSYMLIVFFSTTETKRNGPFWCGIHDGIMWTTKILAPTSLGKLSYDMFINSESNDFPYSFK